MLFNTSNPAHTSVHQKYFAVKSEITIKKKIYMFQFFPSREPATQNLLVNTVGGVRNC